MIYKILIFFTIFIITTVSALGWDIPSNTPKPKSLEIISPVLIKISPKTQLYVPDIIRKKYKAPVTELESVLKNTQVESIGNKNTYDINVKIVESTFLANNIQDRSLLESFLNSGEGYIIEISQNNINITSDTDLGILHGLTTLEMLIRGSDGKLPQLKIIDYPSIKVRALHIVIRMISKNDIISIIQKARKEHYNTLVLQIADGVQLKSMKTLCRPDALTLEEFKDVIQYARSNGLEIIPEIKLLTHQELLLKDKYPELMMNQYTYDPDNEKVYPIIYSVLDEIIEIINPDIIHIGHDELSSYGKLGEVLKKNDKKVSPDSYVNHIIRIHDYLSQKHIKTMIWGDMFLTEDIAKQISFRYQFKSNFGYQLGYMGTNAFAQLLDKLPKDIYIADWHYYKWSLYPSYDFFSKKGFTVWGASWYFPDNIKYFSSYIKKHNSTGMIATTWFYVQRKEWDTVDNIIKLSGEAFWNAK